MTIEITKWDAADHLDSDEKVALYLEAAFEDGDPAVIAAAIGDVARARGMAQVAKDAGLSRESLYKALSEAGNPAFATIMKVTKALGFTMTIAAHRS
ncbi:addiction module antidote protein [Oryzibacter oryziterrae]|uniref:addiction module antidote protein n=1 Tax=Oryzibacter oryziterrae TaxID=2766474 RepID=UPI001F00C9C3|nr:addiction module antidote protein [Oryzibacter oryziterrae]